MLVVQAEPGAELTQTLLGCLDGAGVGRVATREPTLEDAYVALVGERVRRRSRLLARRLAAPAQDAQSRSAFDGLLGVL